MGASRSTTADAAAVPATVTARPGEVAPLPAGGSPDAHVFTPPSSVGRYLVIDEVARGAMGAVLRAYDSRLRREVALKTLLERELSEEGRERMLHEAQAMAKLAHPNVVSVYDVDVTKGAVTMVMEYVPGVTLRTWLIQGRPWREVVAVFAAAGRGLAAAHAAGLLHRDFKPANVLVGDDGRVRVGDFGLAGVHDLTSTSEVGSGDDDRTRPREVMGTPRYMAPEQHEGSALGPAADQYAFCVALWEALTNARLYETADFERLAQSKRNGPPPWPRDGRVPAAIGVVLGRGLAVDPGDRWPSMEALLAALSAAVERQRQRVRNAFAAAAMLATFGVSLAAAGAHRHRLAERCSGAAAQLVGVWNADRRAAIEGAVAATGVAYADGVLRRLLPNLDGYASAWIGIHTAACEATTIRGEQTPEVLDLQMACLQHAKVGFDAVVGVLAEADSTVVEKADDVLATLPDLTRCTEVQELGAEVAPAGRAQADAVAAARVQLAEIKALRAAGRYPQALARTQALTEDAEALDYAPLAAEVAVELGIASDLAGDHRTAEAALRRALRTALASRHWKEAATAAVRLVKVVGTEQARPHEGLAYAQTARALSALAGPVTAAALHGYTGGALGELGRYVEAEAGHRAAVSLAQSRWGPESLEVAIYRGNLGLLLQHQGRYEEAEHEQRTKLALLRKHLGEAHPDVARTHWILGNVLDRQGQYGDAEAQLRTALAICERGLGPRHIETANIRAQLATVLAAQGRYEEAESESAAALQVQREVYGPDHIEVGLALHNIATLLVRQQKYDEAKAKARQALGIFEKLATEHRLLAEVHHTLGSASSRQGHPEEAEVEFAAALAIGRKVLRPGHPSLGRYLIGLASAFEATGRVGEAETALRDGLAALVQSLGEEHPHVAGTRGRLVKLLLTQGRHEEAEMLARHSLASQEASEDAQPLYLAQTQLFLGQALLGRRNVREALPLFERAWSAWRDDSRIPASFRAQLAFGLARASWDSRVDRPRARALAREARGMLEVDPELHRRSLNAIDAWLREHR